jgi:hypothetical protein
MRDAPAASYAIGRVEHTSVVTTGSPGSPGIPRAMVYGVFRALPGVPGFLATVIRELLRELDTSVGVPGPHGFAVRNRLHSSKKLLASTASHPAFLTIAKRPSCRDRMARACRDDLPDRHSEEFLQTGLDNQIAEGTKAICPSGQNHGTCRAPIASRQASAAGQHHDMQQETADLPNAEVNGRSSNWR